jgi:hypothetical protein
VYFILQQLLVLHMFETMNICSIIYTNFGFIHRILDYLFVLFLGFGTCRCYVYVILFSLYNYFHSIPPFWFNNSILLTHTIHNETPEFQTIKRNISMLRKLSCCTDENNMNVTYLFSRVVFLLLLFIFLAYV